MNPLRFSKSLLLSILTPMAMIGASASAATRESVTILVGSMSYPFEVFGENDQLTGGLLKELGEKLAHELGSKPDFMRLPRRRFEPALIAGEADLYCYGSPNWSDNPKALLWSMANLTQIERVLVPIAKPAPQRIPDDFVGKRVSVRLGYHYDAIQPLFDAGKAYRIDESQTAFLFKAVDTGFTDMLITSEGEIEGYFQTNPQARKRFTAAAKPFSVVHTQCAVSPKSRWSLDQINQALTTLIKRGDIERMSKRYGLSMR